MKRGPGVLIEPRKVKARTMLVNAVRNCSKCTGFEVLHVYSGL